MMRSESQFARVTISRQFMLAVCATAALVTFLGCRCVESVGSASINLVPNASHSVVSKPHTDAADSPKRSNLTAPPALITIRTTPADSNLNEITQTKWTVDHETADHNENFTAGHNDRATENRNELVTADHSEVVTEAANHDEYVTADYNELATADHSEVVTEAANHDEHVTADYNEHVSADHVVEVTVDRDNHVVADQNDQRPSGESSIRRAWYEDAISPVQTAPMPSQANSPGVNSAEPPTPANVPPAPAPPIGPPSTPDERNRHEVPLPRPNISLPPPNVHGGIEFHSQDDRLSLTVRDAPLNAVLALIAEHHGLNIVSSSDAVMPVSVTLNRVHLDDALDSILSVAGCTWVRHGNILYVSTVDEESEFQPHVQGRQLRVIRLNFVSAADIEATVQGLLSPVGKTFNSQTDPINQRRAQEVIVVEDLPAYLHRIECYIAQVDRPPRQVLIEAHVLEVELEDETRHGVNFEYLGELAGADVTLRTQGFANPVATPAFFLDIDGTDLDALLEAIKRTTEAKTLASPKVLVLNGQEAKIQIGERLGFFVTTTTQTSTLQDVNFLDVGVVLTVTPFISDDNQILMSVKPKVSKGEVNPDTGLPDEETTEVQTTVILPDGHGIVIGGLIQESDIDQQAKIPFFGDLWVVGRLFQRRDFRRKRSEIVIALVPRVVPYDPVYREQDRRQYQRTTSPLFVGPLQRNCRPGEPNLPDAIRNPRPECELCDGDCTCDRNPLRSPGRHLPTAIGSSIAPWDPIGKRTTDNAIQVETNSSAPDAIDRLQQAKKTDVERTPYPRRIATPDRKTGTK